MNKRDAFFRLKEILIQDALEGMKDSGPRYEQEQDNLVRIIQNVTTIEHVVIEMKDWNPEATLRTVINCLIEEDE